LVKFLFAEYLYYYRRNVAPEDFSNCLSVDCMRNEQEKMLGTAKHSVSIKLTCRVHDNGLTFYVLRDSTRAVAH